MNKVFEDRPEAQGIETFWNKLLFVCLFLFEDRPEAQGIETLSHVGTDFQSLFEDRPEAQGIETRKKLAYPLNG